MSSNDVKSFKVRHVEAEDLEFINKFMEVEHYDVGLTSLRTYYNCSSSTKLWKCMENEKGEIIAVDVGNLLSNGISYAYTLIVKPAYRGKGISSIFKAQWAEYPNIGSESLTSVKLFSNVFQCWRGKMLVFYGMIQGNVAQVYADAHAKLQYDIQMEKITEKNVDKIFDYDKSIIKLDRKKFLKEWSCNDDAQAVVALKNGRCVGFGVLKNFTGFNRYGISPLYADDDNIATAIFAKLAGLIGRQCLYVPAQSHQRVSIQFCHSLNLSFFNSEVRDCDVAALEYVKTINMSKVYTSHDYWPV